MKHPHEDPEWLAARIAKKKALSADPDIISLEKEKRILTLRKEIKQLREYLKEDGHAEQK